MVVFASSYSFSVVFYKQKWKNTDESNQRKTCNYDDYSLY